MSQPYTGPLEKIDDYRWRIPKSYQPGMRVDGIIYATDKLIEQIKKDNAPQQVANVATLPGIVKYSLAMPDIHWGYGFCVTKNTKILTNLGFYKPIGNFEKDWFNHSLKNIDLSSQKPTETSILRFIKLEPKEIFRIVTKGGNAIEATEDHPLFTPLGMRPIKEISPKEKVAVFPFKGIPFETPSNEMIISEKDIKRVLLKLGRKPNTPKFEIILQKLKKRNLLPLTYNHSKLPYILKIMGFVFGDGSMNFIGKRGDGVLNFAGKPQDLEEVRKDLEKIGYTPSPIHFQRKKSSRNSDKYYNCYSFAVNASSLVVLLESLGVPRGSKVNQAYRIPKWIFKAPLWQKRLFLASLFGCELRKPHRRLERRGYFNVPVFPMAKREELIENGKDFLKDISKLLKEFGVRTIYIDKRKRHINTKGKVSWALELLISPKPENLLNLWGKIGFEYNLERSFNANVAVQYLKLKQRMLREKEVAIRVTIPRLLKDGLSYQKIALQLAGNPLTKRFITDVCWKLNKGREIIPRIPASFPLFKDYLREVTQGLGQSGMFWDEVEKIERIPYRDFVYDFTVSHSDHNFIANNFVVSNCIGGVAATDIETGGIIAPGAVGYDVNCFCGNSFIFNELGHKIRIKDYEKIFPHHSITCMDFNKEKETFTKILCFLKRREKEKVFTILTETGRQVTATEDHPFYTKDGMKQLRNLSIGDEVAIYPFEGVEYEKPSSDVIVDKESFKDLLLKLGKTSRGNALNQILAYLDKKDILPLRYDSPQLPYLIKIMGYCFGDGVLYIQNNRKRYITAFYGKKEDLKNMKYDLEKIGFNSKIYSRHRKHKINTMYSTVKFEREEIWLRVASTGFAALLVALGMPIGNKCRQPYNIPKWLFKAPLWQKRLFLAGLFGAELSSPKTMTGHGYNFYCPILSMNKTKDCLDNGRQFLEDISKMLSEFGVKTCDITERLIYINKDGLISHRLRLILSGKTEDLINLYSRVGFEYSNERKFLANVACQYLRLKGKIIKEREQVAVLVPALAKRNEWTTEGVYEYLESPYTGRRFIERSLYDTRTTPPRMWGDDPEFDELKKTATEGLGTSGMVWDRIDEIVDIEYDDWVYDFTVEHPHHNFIADGFVVSNCGVRLIETNLLEKDIKAKQQDLMYALYNKVPAGVGSKGQIKVSHQEERKILTKGVRWALSKGYATEDDIEHTEEKGAIEGANPEAVSERAYERGTRQSGTLGSGNHFIEVQVITDIYDEEAAKVFGLEKGQITVMIHTGSRGFGYQICDDYAKGMVKTLSKFGISVPDRQLACAPFKSEEGKRYFGAMKCAANYAWNNRQCIMYLVRLAFEKVFAKSWQSLGMNLIYDVAHNIAKVEKHTVDGKEMTLCVHRKGATRAFGPGSPDIPDVYKRIGQPIIIPGDMGTSSYLLVGTQKAMDETFGSTVHGAGRQLSRKAAVRSCDVGQLRKELEEKGIVVMAAGRGTIAEEAPMAYKDVDMVVEAVHNAGISKRVCRMRPLCVLKG